MKTESIEVLDAKLKDLGYITLSGILGTKGSSFMTHAGVNSLETFEKWLNMRYEECMRMKVQFIVDGREDDEMYEWVLAHAATFQEVIDNFRNIRK